MIFPYSCTLMACSLTCGTRLHLPTPGSKLGSADLPFLSVNISTWHLERAGDLGSPWMLLSGFQDKFEYSLRGLARAPGEPTEGFCSHVSTRPTPTQPNRAALDWHLSDLQAVFLLPDEKAQNSTLNTLQTELWTESVRDQHHCELVGVGASKSS